MNLQEKAVELLTNYGLCDFCLGRQFSNLATGTTNEERGKSIKNFLAMEFSAELSEENIARIQALSKANSYLAKKILTKQSVIPDKTLECYICEDKLQEIDDLIELIIPETQNYEFSNFLMGTIIPKNILEKETELKKSINASNTEFLKQEFNRNIGKKLTEKLSVITDFTSPEIVIEVNPFLQNVNLRVKSLYIYGKYRKFLRTLPQTRWPCRKCKGRGCKECNNTGKKHAESVEELIEVKAIDTAQGEKGTLHGGGREDIDALMLGSGRPFVFEIVNPQKRTIDLEELEKEINNYANKKIEVQGLRWASKKEVIHVKNSAERAVKKYRALISFSDTVSDEMLEKIQKEFLNKILKQRTPNRVSHRRADKIREKRVHSIECIRKTQTEVEAYVTCDGGCYVKELISGDQGRTIPSISEVVKMGATCIELDVIEIQEIPFKSDS